VGESRRQRPFKWNNTETCPSGSPAKKIDMNDTATCNRCSSWSGGSRRVFGMNHCPVGACRIEFGASRRAHTSIHTLTAGVHISCRFFFPTLTTHRAHSRPWEHVALSLNGVLYLVVPLCT